MSNLRRVALASGSALVLLAGVGCSGSATAPAEIKGMTPAEYREKQEQALGSPADGSPAATAKARSVARKRR